MPGGPEVVIIVAVLLLLFGGTKIPQIARGLGSAQREFREGLQGGDNSAATTPTSEALTPDTVTPPSGLDPAVDVEPKAQH